MDTPPPLHRQSVAWSSGQHGDLLRHLARGGNNKTVAFPYCCCFLILNVVVTRYCVLFLCSLAPDHFFQVGVKVRIINLQAGGLCITDFDCTLQKYFEQNIRR